jgi:hypothetical protein
LTVWPAVAHFGSDTRSIQSRAARRLDVFRLGREAQPRAPPPVEAAGEAHKYSVALRPSLLGQCRWTIHACSRNHNFDPFSYVNSVPAERVAQIHIAGHSKFKKYILDTHDHPGSRLEALRTSYSPRRTYRGAVGVGRQHPFFSESS